MTTPKTALTMKTVRSRVTVVAGIALTATVILGLVIMYLLQRQSAQQNIDSHLRTYAQQIEQAGQGGSWPNPLPTDQLDPNAVAQVIAPDGQVLAATSSLQGKQAIYAADPGSKTPVRQKAAAGVVPNELSVSATHATARLPAFPVTVNTACDPSGIRKVFATTARRPTWPRGSVLISSHALATGRYYVAIGQPVGMITVILRRMRTQNYRDHASCLPGCRQNGQS